LADDTSIVITGKDPQDLIFNPDRINESILLWFDKKRLITNKDKSLALGFHYKSNKHIAPPPPPPPPQKNLRVQGEN
jgi:hypothetical protein